MRYTHFENLRPICPVCRSSSEAGGERLTIARVEREREHEIAEGILVCSNERCCCEFPIIDGIPIIVPDVRAYLAANVFPICMRQDLSAAVESLLGDACGPASAYDSVRQHLHSYGWDGYADLDPSGDSNANPQPASVVRLLNEGLQHCERLPPGALLDVGCGTGRSTFELAEKYDELVLGVDLNFAMLRLAADVLNHGKVRFPYRRVGMVYDRVEFPVEFAHRTRVDFWACDAAALPLARGMIAGAVALNVLDSVAQPIALLQSVIDVLKPSGELIMACPYDWSSAVTDVEGWIGGHSQRGPDHGLSDRWLKKCLAGCEVVADVDGVEWTVRLHDRGFVQYRSHLVVVRKN